mgnify:CR=1 FL=1
MNREDPDEEYLEIDTDRSDSGQKVIIKLFHLKKYEDVNEILNTLREGYTVALVDIRELRKKDLIELKRAVAKIKKTAEALEGSIAGFGENMVIIAPQFARIEKEELPSEQPKKRPEYY